ALLEVPSLSVRASFDCRCIGPARLEAPRSRFHACPRASLRQSFGKVRPVPFLFRHRGLRMVQTRYGNVLQTLLFPVLRERIDIAPHRRASRIRIPPPAKPATRPPLVSSLRRL